MTGAAYQRSAELAGVVGPYDGYARNADAHKRVMRKHAAANDDVAHASAIDRTILRRGRQARGATCLEIGEENGWRNAQATVLAPTGCLDRRHAGHHRPWPDATRASSATSEGDRGRTST